MSRDTAKPCPIDERPKSAEEALKWVIEDADLALGETAFLARLRNLGWDVQPIPTPPEPTQKWWEMHPMFQVVELLERVMADDGVEMAAGSRGTIVAILAAGVFSVEFVEPRQTLVDAPETVLKLVYDE